MQEDGFDFPGWVEYEKSTLNLSKVSDEYSKFTLTLNIFLIPYLMADSRFRHINFLLTFMS
jgi:hypothetical protein